MNTKFTLTLALFVLSTIAFAQFGPVGHLTIFSESGDKFYLILNGERQNDIPQTNLRVEDLNQPYYNAKIIFEDKTLQEVTKNNLMLTDVDGNYADVTYKIKKDKNNKTKMKLNYYSSIPVQQGYIPPSNVYVMHYGQPRPASGSSQTTTTTTVNQGVNVGASVNVGGVNMNVNINDPYGTSVSETTTTTTHSSSGNHNHHDDDAPRGCKNQYAMNGRDFDSAIATIKKQSFEETKLKTAKQIITANCLNVNQISQICQSFSFEDSKLDFAKFAYQFCVEPKNYFKLNSIFSFSSSVDDLTDYVQSRN